MEYEVLNAAHDALKAELAQKVKWLMEQLRLHQQKRFGVSTEKMDEGALEQPSLLFNEAEVYTKPSPLLWLPMCGTGSPAV